MSMHHLTPSTTPAPFSDRIKVLIQRVGSATQIARMCGFSEGVVRSWRDGNTDPSRARCVTLARTLGISLVWLVAGEGAIQIDPAASSQEEQYNTEVVSNRQPRTRLGAAAVNSSTVHDGGVDTQRLNTAMKILQSELELSESGLSLAESTDLLSELYELLGPKGTNMDTSAMVTFNHRLAERIRQSRTIA